LHRLLAAASAKKVDDRKASCPSKANGNLAPSGGITMPDTYTIYLVNQSASEQLF
jgi:hypothetical protein